MTLRVQVGFASRPIASETECGDQIGVVQGTHSTTIVVADGLGHGREAAAAAKRAVSFVRERATLSLTELMHGCHTELRSTRGAAVTILRLSGTERTLDHVAIGNVELTTATRESIKPIALAGIVGARMRKVMETKYKVHAGDVLLLFTDGVSSRLSVEPFRALEAQAAADAILSRHGKPQDDAACVVVCCGL
jgi:hypothetical protein